MGKIILFFTFVFSAICVGQTKDLKAFRQTDDLEGYTYFILDEFLKAPTEENLRVLPGSFWRKPKSNSEKLALVIYLCNRGYYESQFGHTVSAVESYEKGWHLFEKNKLKDYDIVAFCLKPLGNLYTVLGDYDNAENTIKQYYFIADQQKDNPQEIAAVLNLSNVYQSSGKPDESIELLTRTLKTEKLSPTIRGKILSNLGASHIIVHNWQEAKANLELAIALLRKDKNEAEALSNAFRNLATVFAERNENEKASLYFEKARLAFLISANREPRKHAKLYYDIAVMLFRQRKMEQSKQNLHAVFKILIQDYDQKTGLPEQKSLYAETVLLDALDLFAMLYSEEKQYQKALFAYSLSFHIESLFAPLFVYENTKLLAQLRNRERTEKCLSIYQVLYQTTKSRKWIENAFLLSEKTKSGVLKDYLSDLATVSPKEKQILEQLQTWNALILREQQKKEIAEVRKINEAIRKQNELVLLLKSVRTEKSELPSEFGIPDLHQKLAESDTRMISYFAGSEKLYWFSIDGKTIKMQASASGIYTKIRNFISFFKRANAIADSISGYQKSAFELYSLLQIGAATKTKNLLLLPDGVLNFMPFEPLLTKPAVTSDFARMPYLIKDYTIGYNNSAAFYMTDPGFHFEKETVLGAFPVFEGTPLELSFSKQELTAIKKLFSGKYLENRQATFDNFKHNAPLFSILHLSTHAGAGDLETPATLRFYDREILYSELYALDIHPDLVVLSACETGIGKLYKGEGAMSVARGFQFAGAKNLLFSLWKVNDFTTSVQMASFYSNLKSGHSYLESNHLSKTEYLDNYQIPNLKKSPYYWAAMVYYGEDQSRPQHNYLWIIWVLFIAIALFLGYRKLLKKNGEITRFPE